MSRKRRRDSDLMPNPTRPDQTCPVLLPVTSEGKHITDDSRKRKLAICMDKGDDMPDQGWAKK